MPTEDAELYRPEATDEAELPARTAHFMDTDSILIDVNLGSMLE
jgi:hypothetical protein